MVYRQYVYNWYKEHPHSELMNNVSNKCLKPNHNFMYFFENHNKLLSDKLYDELKVEYKMRERVLVFSSRWPGKDIKDYTSEEEM